MLGKRGPLRRGFEILVAALTICGCSVAPTRSAWHEPPPIPSPIRAAVRATGALRGEVIQALSRHPVRLAAPDAVVDITINGELLLDGQPATTAALGFGRSVRRVAVQITATDEATKRIISPELEEVPWAEPRATIPFIPPYFFNINLLSAERDVKAVILEAVVRAVDRIVMRLPREIAEVRLEESAFAAKFAEPGVKATVAEPPAVTRAPYEPRASVSSAFKTVPPVVENRCTREIVEAVQLALRRHGPDPGPIDGVLGRLTRAAIQRFQSGERLPRTGRLDEETVARLKDLEEQSSTPRRGTIVRFQANEGLASSGRLDPQTFRRLSRAARCN